MTETRQHGRRRAEPARKSSIFSPAPAAHDTPALRRVTPVTATTKYLTAVAVVGALLGAAAVAQQTVAPAGLAGSDAQLDLLTASQAIAAPVSAPSDAVISFAAPGISSTASATPSATALKAEGGSVAPASSAAPAPVNDPAAAKAFAAGELASFGWGADQMQCLSLLWQRESEWLTSAENASSGAYGIAQSLPADKMASTGSDWATNHETQIRWGLSYISGRYGSPCGAWGHSESVGWY